MENDSTLRVSSKSGSCTPLVQPKFGSMRCSYPLKGSNKAVEGTVCRFACKKGKINYILLSYDFFSKKFDRLIDKL